MKNFIIFFVVFLVIGEASAKSFHLVLNGRSFHKENNNYNETNTGLGFELEFNEKDEYIKFIAASSFKDSLNKTSNYFGGGVKRRYYLENNVDGWYGDLAIIAFAMTRKDYKNNRPFLAALPFLTIGKGRLAINMIYIPKISVKSTSLFYFQAKMRMLTW